MTLEEFAAQYTGLNLRWETVGIIITLAGLVFSILDFMFYNAE